MVAVPPVLLVLALSLLQVSAEPVEDKVPALTLSGEAAEQFLLNAEVVGKEAIKTGVTLPKKLTLTDGTLELNAAWKTIDDFKTRAEMEDGKVDLGFRDTYKHEIAAYKLSKLLGLDFVPPTVKRRLYGKDGSLQLWLNGCISESKRLKEQVIPPDRVSWNHQMHNVRVFHQLIYDTDYNNVNNLLVDSSFKIWVIDSSRAFRLKKSLRKHQSLRRFSKSLLERLRSLDKPILEAELGTLLTPKQIDTLLIRRDLIIELAEKRVAEYGERAIIFD
jgi:hypothetical protein